MSSERHRRLRPAGSALLVLLMVCHGGVGAETGANGQPASGAEAASNDETTGNASAVADAPLAAYRLQLLDLAFEAASKMPLNPHIKNRSRAQEEVVEACFELDQPVRALRCIERIDNWRRGTGYADYAFYCARHGYTIEVPEYLDRADRVADEAESWRRARIRLTIAKTHAWLGQKEDAARFQAGAARSEAGELVVLQAEQAQESTFQQHMESVDRAVVLGDFDRIQNGLRACVTLFDRFYGDPERREQAELRVKSAWEKLPSMLRIELMMGLIEAALAHQDPDKALALVGETNDLMDRHRWSLEYRARLGARLAELRYRAGDRERARADVQALLDLYEKDRETIGTIYRADALRPLAEACQVMGDTALALAVYKRAVEEGVVNPNSRPRAADLSATCCSMARHGVEPDAELWARMREIHEGLGHPW